MPLLDTIVNEARAEQQREALRTAAYDLIGNIDRIYHHVGTHLEACGVLAARHGLTPLLAELPAEVAQNLQSFFAQMQVIWPGMSSVPFPELPDEPVEISE
jgi:hypothetical protein